MWRLLIVYSVFKLAFGGGNSIPGWGGPSYILISSHESENFVIENFFDDGQEGVTKRPKLGNNAREIYPEYLMSGYLQPPESTVSLQSKEVQHSFYKNSDNKHHSHKPRKSQEFLSESSFESKSYSEPSKIQKKKSSVNSESSKLSKNKENEEAKLKKGNELNDSQAMSSQSFASELSSKNLTQYNTTKKQDADNKNNTKEENDISPRRSHEKLSIDSEPSTTIQKPENKTALNIRSSDEENKETTENESAIVSPSRKILRRLVQKSKSRDD